METLATRGRQHKEEVPVHGDGDCALVVLPRRVQVCAGQVGSIEPPCSLGGDGGMEIQAEFHELPPTPILCYLWV